jgi:thioredoxin-like negative regulator of GroEL
MTHIEFISAEWAGPCVEMRHTIEKVAPEFPGVQWRHLEAEELAVCPAAVPVLRLVVDGKRVRETVGNQSERVVREFFEAANEK